jgi:DNA-binding FrmR family transcriptional regulator
MSHTSREKTKLLNRVRRIKGQMEAVERHLDEDKGCAEVLQLIAGIRGAINGLMGEIIEDHIKLHVADSELSQTERDEGAAELIDVVRAYMK